MIRQVDLVYSDNMRIVGSWRRDWGRKPRTMAMNRYLLFRSAAQRFLPDIQYINTMANGAADALSRGDIERFRQLRREARKRPEALSSAVCQFMQADLVTTADGSALVKARHHGSIGEYVCE